MYTLKRKEIYQGIVESMSPEARDAIPDMKFGITFNDDTESEQMQADVELEGFTNVVAALTATSIYINEEQRLSFRNFIDEMAAFDNFEQIESISDDSEADYSFVFKSDFTDLYNIKVDMTGFNSLSYVMMLAYFEEYNEGMAETINNFMIQISNAFFKLDGRVTITDEEESK